MSHINKKHKDNNDKNNDGKIIVLPIIIQKYILTLLYESYNSITPWYNKDGTLNQWNFGTQTESINSFGYHKSQKRELIHNLKGFTRKIPYVLVNWTWFKICRSLISNYYLYYFSSTEKDCSDENTKFMNKHSIKNMVIDFMDISSELVNKINSFKSLESIVVSNHIGSSELNEILIGDSVWILTHLNKLNDDIIVNFDLFVHSCPDKKSGNETDNPNYIEKETFTFKVGYFNVTFDYEDPYNKGINYGYFYDIIKDLPFKSIEFISYSDSDSGSTHLQQYHSISKLNQHYESVVIKDYIPLYALYRFLKSPNLCNFQFNLQFHYLSSIYERSNNSDDISATGNLNFDEMDTFQFKDFKGEENDFKKKRKDKTESETFQFYFNNEYQVYGNIKDYIEYGINEDNQVYCSYSRQENECTEIPPYSKLLLKECLELLKNNKTITHLKIVNEHCGGCDKYSESILSDHFLNDLFDSLSSNNTIKELYLDFNDSIDDSQMESLTSKVTMLLNQNSTLEIVFVNGLNVDEISELTTNTKCKLMKIKIEIWRRRSSNKYRM